MYDNVQKRSYFEKRPFSKEDKQSQSAHRIIALIFRLMSKEGISFDEITTELKISERTAFRYLRQIANEGFVLYRDTAFDRYYIETKII